MAVYRNGMDKIEAAARAVDMPLRLDNANALPIPTTDTFSPKETSDSQKRKHHGIRNAR
jgi:hypothetical protein